VVISRKYAWLDGYFGLAACSWKRRLGETSKPGIKDGTYREVGGVEI
jgi:hypothetical protein